MSQPPSKARRRSTKFVKGLMFTIFATSAIGMVVGGMRFGGGGAPQAPAKRPVAQPLPVQPGVIDDDVPVPPAAATTEPSADVARDAGIAASPDAAN